MVCAVSGGDAREESRDVGGIQGRVENFVNIRGLKPRRDKGDPCRGTTVRAHGSGNSFDRLTQIEDTGHATLGQPAIRQHHDAGIVTAEFFHDFPPAWPCRRSDDVRATRRHRPGRFRTSPSAPTSCRCVSRWPRTSGTTCMPLRTPLQPRRFRTERRPKQHHPTVHVESGAGHRDGHVFCDHHERPVRCRDDLEEGPPATTTSPRAGPRRSAWQRHFRRRARRCCHPPA